MVERIIALDKQHLKDLIDGALDAFGNECDLNYIDTSKITDMSELFDSSPFNGDISQWNPKHALFTDSMFTHSVLEKQRRLPAWYQQQVYLRNRNIVN